MKRDIRPMTDDERQASIHRGRVNMTTATSTAEIRLYNAMVNNSLTIDEAIIAMEQFRDHLNVDNLIIQNEGVDNRAKIYDNDFAVLDEWDTWTD